MKLQKNKKSFFICESANRNNRGFVLLYAVLVASIALSIGISLYGITLKELLISSSSRDSQLAFYAADAGAECALYWDVQEKAFSTSTQNSIACASLPMTVGGGTISNFSISSFPNGACADVIVDKSIFPQTVITSQGYNTCNLNDPRRVERTLRVTY
ncbi:MAG: hypothetical protein HZC03_00715 [Candidatus Lloydbacteria bacterium]|nr:hypothetical protein [Candidatus Lloydbacteria bacterium]